MKIARFEHGGEIRVGTTDGIATVTPFPREITVAALIEGRFRDMEINANEPLPLSAVRLLAPVETVPNNIFCTGLNYVDHVAEGEHIAGAKIELPAAPTFFTKTASTLNAPVGGIPYWTTITQALDYEIELAVIIGKGGRDIPRARAMEHVFGYTVANDVTARDLQFGHGGQWFKGKSLDGSLPLGPWIVTRDEIPDVAALELVLTVNGEERQRASVSQMIFDIPTLIESLSAGLTLSPGDVILTGTPAGVGAGFVPPNYLAAGDEVVCTIDGVGSLRHTVVAVS